MILRQIHDLIPRNESDEAGIQLLAEFGQKFLFAGHIATVSDDTCETHLSLAANRRMPLAMLFAA